MSTSPVYAFLITRGGDVIRMVGVAVLFMQGLGWDDSLGLCCPMSPGCTMFFKQVAQCMRRVP